MPRLTFPDAFTWGAATSAYQIEGAATADGKGRSIWDEFTERPGQIPGGATGEVACDSYHRWAEDVDLLRDAHLGAYRMSLSWPRLIPDGVGAANQAGIDSYRRLFGALRGADIAPFVTLYHWDLPLALQERGGWEHRNIADWFAEYAERAAGWFGDLVDDWWVLNEPNIHGLMGFLLGKNAPGRTGFDAFLAAAHHQNLAQGRAVLAMREAAPSARIGTVISLQQCPPATSSDDDRAAAEQMDLIANRIWLDPLLRGRYPDGVEDLLDASGVTVADGDLADCHQPLDFVGVNYYGDFFTKATPKGPELVIGSDQVRTNQVGFPFTPDGLYRILVELRDDYENPPVYISENGTAEWAATDDDVPLEDPFRIQFLHEHLVHLHRAIADGCDVRGYFAWSLIDNFEWEWGYQQRYGMVKVDMRTGERTPKASYRWYSDVASANAVDTI